LLLEFGADVARPLPIVDYSTTEKHPLKDEAPYPLWNVLRPFRRDVAQRMIDARANVNAALPNGWTIFDHYDRQYHHTFYGESGALTFLLEAGARFGLEVETSPGVFASHRPAPPPHLTPFAAPPRPAAECPAPRPAASPHEVGWRLVARL
jgi:hypothetical protein